MSDAIGPPPPPFAPDALGRTDEAGQSIDAGKGRIFPCEGCGADFEFNIQQQKLKCPYCGFEKDIEFSEDESVQEQDLAAMLERLRTLRQERPAETAGEADPTERASEVRCESCGGTTVFLGTLTSSECPYCGSPIQRDHVHDAVDRVPVDGVLPFRVERKQAQSNLARWVKSRWFAPNDFLNRGVKGQFNGVYMPYWTYDSLTFTRYSGARGEHYYVTVGHGDKQRRERRTSWYPASGQFRRFFDDVMVVASRIGHRDLIHELEPWPLGQCCPFNQEMLAGYLARTYDIELDQGFNEARERMEAALYQDVCRRIGGDEQRVDSVRTRHSAVTFKHVLLPVWLLAYRYKGKSYQVYVNAATGEVQGQRPYSAWKIALAVLCGLAALGAILYLQN